MNRPSYIDLNDKEKEEFLSQRGSFSPDERTMFRELLASWEPMIEYQRFLKRVRETGGPTLIQSLMGKLYKARVGLLRTQVVDGERRPVAIVLAEEESFDFYYEAVCEAYVDLTDSIVNLLPLRSRLVERGLEIPEEHLTLLDAEALPSAMREKEKQERCIAVLASLNKEELILPSSHLRSFINIAMLKVRYYMSNTSLLEQIARYQDTSLMAIKQSLGAKEPGFWLGLSSTVVDKRKELRSSRNVSVESDFYHSCYLIRRLITAQMEEAKERKRQEKEREIDLETVAVSVKEADSPLLEQSEMVSILEQFKGKYASDFEGFQEEFYRRYVHSKGNRSLPKVVKLEDNYIHRDNVYPFFIDRFQLLSSELRRYYKELMADELRRSSGNNPVFFSHENFENDIRSQVSNRDSFVSQVLAKPAVLAEAVILYAKQKKQVQTVDELKQRISVYFNPESMKLLDLPTIFNLPLGQIYDAAFEQLHILRRIWVRLTGKYDAVRDKFVSRQVVRSTAVNPRPKLNLADDTPGVVEPPRPDRPGDRARKRGEPSTTARYSSSRGDSLQRRRGAKPGGGERKEVKRPYSKKQQDSAWQNFGESIKKKDD
ncbi:MAG: hypothetical protein ACOC28_03200 [Alkalispirochaetaceae bacterium]